jgi:hypothetical protein
VSIDHLLTQTVTLEPFVAGAEDRYGNEAEGYGPGVEEPCRLEQTSGTEVTDGRDALVSDWQLFLRANTTATGRSRATVDGRVFEVVGPPAEARTARAVSHVVARLRHVEG